MTEKNGVIYDAISMILHEGAQEARVTLVEGSNTSITLFNGEPDSMLNATNMALHLNIFADGRYGVFTTNRLDTDELRRFIRNAVQATRLAVPDEFRILPPKNICYDGKGPDLKINDPAYFQITPNRKMDILREVTSGIPRDSRLISTESQYEDEYITEKIIDSNGLDVSESRTSFSISTECTVRDEGDLRPQNWWCDGSIHFSGLKRTCGAMALSRAIEMTGAVKLPSGHYDVVLENTCARSIVSTLMNALYGSALQQRNSFLTDSIGKKLFPETMSLCDKPHIPGMAGSTWYDAEGIATADMDIIREGKVCNYFLGTYYALKMGMKVTVQSPSAVRFTRNDGTDCQGLIKNIGRGILVTGFNGGNCNPVTGDFSYGVEGFLFENGEKTHPIKEMNFTGNMLTLWSRLLLTGNDSKDWTRWQIPSLAFGKCEFSGL